jgi:hypothetical protein
MYDRVFLSLASDFESARVRLAIGKPGAFNVEDDLPVPAGRSVVREFKGMNRTVSLIRLFRKRAARGLGLRWAC